MADQSYGLRFDIYERVHLSENVAGIEELEEIELIPRIQVISGDEYASLRGHLLLTGLYRGEGGPQELEHWIPVEITIPLTRVGRLEDIAVEIENFDVDLLSARSLNITGVLSLKGIETSSLTTEAEEWRDRELVVAHEPGAEADLRGDEEAEREAETERQSFNPYSVENFERSYTEHFRAWEREALPDSDAVEPIESQHRDEQQTVLTWNDASSPLFAQSVAEDKEGGTEEQNDIPREPELTEDDVLEQELTDVIKADARQEVTVTEIVLDGTAEENKDGPSREGEVLAQVSEEASNQTEQEIPVYEASVESENGQAAFAEAEPADQTSEIRPEAEEKKELKIALGSKKSADSSQDNQFGITKLLSAQRVESESAPHKPEETAVPAAAEQGDGEEVRWKSLFIGNAQEQTPFRKVKLVIVQREETLDEIAERYQLSSRELQLYNRLSEQNLAEGQVLYIP